ncbi:MAG: bifunctional UDP-N-acetylglucosamine diphosphorylase/glucosamine-1-phosphate N-acetyltransferase GlmU [Dehalococcoidia bacterium]
MNSYDAVILAAGKGTRMKSRIPKVLHRIAGTEMLKIILITAKNAGISSLVTIVPEDHDQFITAVGQYTQLAVQKEAKGSGHAVLQSKPLLNKSDNIVVLNGDVPLIKSSTLSEMMLKHSESDATVTLLTSRQISNEGMGRIVRSDDGYISSIIEDKEATPDLRKIDEVNAGIYCFRGEWLWQALESLKISGQGEYYLTDLIALANVQGLKIESIESMHPHEAQGVNNRVELSKIEAVQRENILNNLMRSGVTIVDPNATYIDLDVNIGIDTTIYPNTYIKSGTQIGHDCVIGPNSNIDSSSIGNSCKIESSSIESSDIKNRVHIGPYSHIRSGTVIEDDVHIGNYSEIKNSSIGKLTKCGHFSYIGDAQVGSQVNIGAGTITCNYDGERKNKTVIEEKAFIGCDTMLVAPVHIGIGATTGAGSVVNKDVPNYSKAVGSPARVLGRKRSS